MKKIALSLLALLAVVCLQAQTVTPPNDATIEDDWMCSFVMHSTNGDETVSEMMKVAFSGTDVYFHLPNPIAGNTWVKGTLSNNVATFAKGQYLGNYQGAVYMVGQDEQGICDVVFGYDEVKQAFILGDMQVVLNSSATAIGNNTAWAYYMGMTVVKGGEVQGDTWTFSYTMHYLDNLGNEQTESGNETMDVVINGDDLSFNFPNPLNGAAWITGTLDGSVATFPKGQQMGTYGGSPFYLAGQDENGLCDVVFNYDASKQVFTLGDMYLLINSSKTQSSPWCYFSKATISKGTAVVDEPDELVELPEGLTARDYVYTAKSVIYDQTGAIDHMEDVARPVKVAFNGSDEVYVRGLCEELPLAWVKGTVSTGSWDEKIVTFAAGQYLGKFTGYSLYLMGKYMNVFGDAYLELDGDEMKNRGFFYINTSKQTEAPLDVYANNAVKKLTVKAAVPAAPAIYQYINYNNEEGYAPLMLDIPTTDTAGNVIAPSLLGFRIVTEKGGEQQPYTFTKSKYTDLPEEELSVIPYELATGYNFYYGGSLVFLNDNLEDNDRFGVQSVYTAGGKTNVSEIAWFQFETQGVNTVESAEQRVDGCYDLSGRRVAKPTKGLYIINGKKIVIK